jgi:hypothetical protein
MLCTHEAVTREKSDVVSGRKRQKNANRANELVIVYTRAAQHLFKRYGAKARHSDAVERRTSDAKVASKCI